MPEKNESGEILGMSPEKQHNLVAALLFINAVFCGFVFLYSRHILDPYTGMFGLGYMMASVFAMFASLLRNYDLSLGFSAIGLLFSGMILVLMI